MVSKSDKSVPVGNLSHASNSTAEAICKQYGHIPSGDINTGTHCSICSQELDEDFVDEYNSEVKPDANPNTAAKKEICIRITEMTKEDINDWFCSIGMDVHAERFLHKNYDGKKICSITRDNWARLHAVIPFPRIFFHELKSLKDKGYTKSEVIMSPGDRVYAKIDGEWKLGEIKHVGYGTHDYGIKFDNQRWISGRNSNEIKPTSAIHNKLLMGTTTTINMNSLREPLIPLAASQISLPPPRPMARSQASYYDKKSMYSQSPKGLSQSEIWKASSESSSLVSNPPSTTKIATRKGKVEWIPRHRYP